MTQHIDDWARFLRYEAAPSEPPMEEPDDAWERGRDAFRADRLDPRAVENPEAQRYLDESVDYHDMGQSQPFGYGQGNMRNWQARPNDTRDPSSFMPWGHDDQVVADRGPRVFEPESGESRLHGRGPHDPITRAEFIRRFNSGADISDDDLVDKYGQLSPFQDPRARPRHITPAEHEEMARQASEDMLREQGRWNLSMGDHTAAHNALREAGYHFDPDEHGGDATYRRNNYPYGQAHNIQPTGDPDRPWQSWVSGGFPPAINSHETLDQALSEGDDHHAQVRQRYNETAAHQQSWVSDQERSQRSRGGGGSRSRYGPEYVRSGLSTGEAISQGIGEKQHFPREQSPKFYGEWQHYPASGGYLSGRGHEHYQSLFHNEDGSRRTNPDGSPRRVYTVTHWSTPLASYVEGEGWHIFNQSHHSQADVDRINAQPRVRDLRDDMPSHSWSVTTARRNRDIRWAIRRSGDPIARDEQSWAHDQVQAEIGRRAEERAERAHQRRMNPQPAPGSWAREIRRRRGPGTDPFRPTTMMPGQEPIPGIEATSMTIMDWSHGLRE